VFRDKIAERGLSMFVLYSKKGLAHLNPFSCCIFKYDKGVESSTASIIEQRKETNNARKR
jgi:hypothetical protein